MGHTNYWKFSSAPKGEAKQVEETYQLAIRQCQRLIRAYNADLKAQDAKHPNRLSGYSVHTKVGQYGGLEFNGVQDEGHETFSMREHFSENEGFNFCKTNRKPYDVAVKACLLVFKKYLGDLIEISADTRNDSEWDEARELIEKHSRLKLVKAA